MVAGAPDRADAEPFGRNRVEFAVAMPRDQDLGAMIFPDPDERRQEMLAMPEHEDRRQFRIDDIVDVGRFVAEAVGEPDQPQIFGRQKSDESLQRRRPRNPS